MKKNAKMIGLRTNLGTKDNLAMSEGAPKDITCELNRKREKWFKAVEYFTCVDDVNF
ncbi:hypothetical protein [Methanomethylovorans sp.]|uniref:hypothetical protein n=1 Tax=Methanomethylovorans sp. TaxID=2758717 RepID=UPI00351C751D